MTSPASWNRIRSYKYIHQLPLWLAALLALSANSSFAQEGGVESQSQTLQIFVSVERAEEDPRNALKVSPGQRIKVLQGLSVRISGVAPTVLAGKQLRVVITPPQSPEIPDPNNPEPPEEPDPEAKLPVDIKESPELTGGGQLRPTPPSTLLVTAATDGSFSTTYATVSPGDHEVEVTDAAEKARGSAGFSPATAGRTASGGSFDFIDPEHT